MLFIEIDRNDNDQDTSILARQEKIDDTRKEQETINSSIPMRTPRKRLIIELSRYILDDMHYE